MRATGAATDHAIGLAGSFDPGDGSRPRYATVGSRVPVDPRPLAGERALGVILSGQSTIASWALPGGYIASQAKSLQVNVFDRRAYLAQDPVFGCDGDPSGHGGSPSSAIGDYLISSHKYDRVLVANASFGSTSSQQWSQALPNTLAQGLIAAWELVVAMGYTNIKHAHQQGEADAGISGITQAAVQSNILGLDAWRRNAGIVCPMYVSLTTFSYGGWTRSSSDPTGWFLPPGTPASLVRAAQAAVVNGSTILAGPDTDLIRGAAYGRDGNAHPALLAGQLGIAQLWAAVL